MSRTDDANVRAATGAREAAADAPARYAEELSGIDTMRPSSLEPIGARIDTSRPPCEGPGSADESERARLIADLTRLIREPAMPEATRVAGLTLIGWLARRRPEEAPHAVGVEEARQSERRLKAARPKPR